MEQHTKCSHVEFGAIFSPCIRAGKRPSHYACFGHKRPFKRHGGFREPSEVSSRILLRVVGCGSGGNREGFLRRYGGTTQTIHVQLAQLPQRKRSNERRKSKVCQDSNKRSMRNPASKSIAPPLCPLAHRVCRRSTPSRGR